MPRTKILRPKTDYPKALILERMNATGTTIEDLAKPLKCSTSTAYRLFRTPTESWQLSQLLSVCRHLAIPIDDLRPTIRY